MGTGNHTQLAPGTVAGAYVVQSRIASGGFGTVYRAQARNGELVALKVLHMDLVGSPEAVARFEREVRAVRRLRHDNVAAIHDLGELPGRQPYFVMDLLTGVSLRRRLRDGGRFAPDDALAVLEPVCDALAAAHALGIVHRDVKSSNVFLTDDGGVSLLDFGIAKLMDDTGDRITASRQIVGSPPCLAPEQILGRDVDERTDVYALGVLGYEMLTGVLPFGHADVLAVCDMHLNSPPPQPSRRAPVGSVFDGVIERAMAKDPDARFASVGEFAAAFRAAALSLAAEPVFAPVAARPAIAVHVAVELSTGAPAALPESAYEAIESLLPRARATFGDQGFRVVMDSQDALLLVAPLPSDRSEADELRARVLRAAVSFERAAAGELVGVPVRIAVFVHVGDEQLLVHPGQWLPDDTPAGVYGTAAALDAIATDTGDGPDGFRRLETPPTV